MSTPTHVPESTATYAKVGFFPQSGTKNLSSVLVHTRVQKCLYIKPDTLKTGSTCEIYDLTPNLYFSKFFLLTTKKVKKNRLSVLKTYTAKLFYLFRSKLVRAV